MAVSGQRVQPWSRLQAVPGHMVVNGALRQMLLPSVAVASTDMPRGEGSAGGSEVLKQAEHSQQGCACTPHASSTRQARTGLGGGRDLGRLSAGAVVLPHRAAGLVRIIRTLYIPPRLQLGAVG